MIVPTQYKSTNTGALSKTPFSFLEQETNPTSGKGNRISDYRFGFNGMEKDDEIKGSGNSYDFGARIYDPRLGRWFSMDPLATEFASWSPYNFVLNNPVRYIDVDGRAPSDPIQRLNYVARSTNHVLNDLYTRSHQSKKTPNGNEEWSAQFLERSPNGSSESWGSAGVDVVGVRTDHITGGVNPAVIKITDGEKIIGRVHTHPNNYMQGNAFSATDINSLRGNVEKGYFSMVEAGNKRFALMIDDAEKASNFFENNSVSDIEASWQAAFDNANASGGFSEDSSQESLIEYYKSFVKETLGSDSGIKFYETTDDKKQSFGEVE